MAQQDQLSQEQLKHNTDIQEYQNKYKALIEELEKVRTIPKVKKYSAAIKILIKKLKMINSNLKQNTA